MGCCFAASKVHVGAGVSGKIPEKGSQSLLHDMVLGRETFGYLELLLLTEKMRT